MKKLILLLLFLPLIAFAFEEGQVLTQEELNDLNVSKFTLQTLQCRFDRIQNVTPTKVELIHSCLDIMEQGENYLIIRDEGPISFSVIQIRKCLWDNLSNPVVCQNQLITNLNQQRQSFVNGVKNRIAYHQTTWLSQIREWLRGMLP